MRLDGPCRAGSPTWHRRLEKGAVVGSGLDQAVRHARNFGGDGDERLALGIGVAGAAAQVALVLVPETVFLRADGDLRRHPEDATEPGVSVLRKPALAAVLTRLVGREIQAAEF